MSARRDAVTRRALHDGNKRAAWVALRLFIEINGWRHLDDEAVVVV